MFGLNEEGTEVPIKRPGAIIEPFVFIYGLGGGNPLIPPYCAPDIEPLANELVMRGLRRGKASIPRERTGGMDASV